METKAKTRKTSSKNNGRAKSAPDLMGTLSKAQRKTESETESKTESKTLTELADEIEDYANQLLAIAKGMRGES